MPLRLLARVAVTGCIASSCDGIREPGIQELCSALEACHVPRGKTEDGVPFKSICEKELDDAIEDGRMNIDALLKCNECVKNNASPRCSELLTRRDCDRPCADVAVVLRSHSLPEQRKNACQAFDPLLRGGNGESSVAACLDEVNEAVVHSHEDGTEADAQLAQCAGCLGQTLLDDGRTRSDGSLLTTLDLCESACAPVQVFQKYMASTRDILTVCAANIPRCSLDEPSDAGVKSLVCEPDLETMTEDDCSEALRGYDIAYISTCAVCVGTFTEPSAIQRECAPVCQDLAGVGGDD
jgi:hypothetical protein